MDYQHISSILNRHIFADDRKELLRSIADNPDRFVGLFRPTKPGTKLLQYLLQSHEIRFGGAMEELTEAILAEAGFTPLEKVISGADGQPLVLDLYCSKGSSYYLIEQKVRDDHDSTKKRGQLSNFEAKIEALTATHGAALVAIMYFLDPSLIKNKGYYQQEIARLAGFYGITIHLFYGPELFEHFGIAPEWSNLLTSLRQWKDELPDLPDVNMDVDPKAALEEIKVLGPRVFRRLIETDALWADGIMRALSRDGTTLRMLLAYFRSRSEVPYRELANLLADRLSRHYSASRAERG